MRWMSQWQSAGVELEKVKTRELRELSAESSSLVEQQAIFMRSRSHASCY
jgi:hypothetical protein